MRNRVSVRLITVNSTYDSKWFITVNNENPFSLIITRFPKETHENLIKEINSLPDLEQTTISERLDQKKLLYLY